MNNKRGISLITLIITIIVIIILAGAIILSLNNTNIIENANKAVTEQDKVSLIDTYNMITMDKFVANSTKDEPIGNIDISELYTKIGKDLGDKFKVENNNLLEKQGDGSYDVIAKFPNSASYTRTKSKSSFNNPYIPKDFDYVEGKWDTGLVIKNKIDGNEFVWIPVKNESEYQKRDFGMTNIKLEETLDEDNAEFNNLIEVQKANDPNVVSRGGFYIGRYEAGVENERTSKDSISDRLLIQKGKFPYNNIEYRKALAMSMDLYNKNDCVSILTTGKQWDAACMFLGEEYACDSTGKGNLNGITFIKTGENENYKLKNVYDMAGNCSEWTCEKTNGTEYVRNVRGGTFNIYNSSNWKPSSAGNRSNFPYVASRDFIPTTAQWISFRVSLYIK